VNEVKEHWRKLKIADEEICCKTDAMQNPFEDHRFEPVFF
jgi:hypothetical protein